MSLQDTDLLYLDRGGVQYQVTWADIKTRSILATDQFLIQRGFTYYRVPIGDFWTCSEVSTQQDYYLIERGGKFYHETIIFPCEVQIDISASTSTVVYMSGGPDPVTGESPYIQNPDGTRTILTTTPTAYTLTQNGSYLIGGNVTQFQIQSSDGSVDASPTGANVWANVFAGVPNFGENLFNNINLLTGVPAGLVLESLDRTFEGTNPDTTDLGSLDVSAVTSAVGTFLNSDIDPSDDISTWDVSNVTNMSRMFEGSEFFDVNISGWDIAAVTDMSSFLKGATRFDQDLSPWAIPIAGVSNMASMFEGAATLNQDLSTWDVSTVTDMNSMFNGASNFNQDLGDWDVEEVRNMDSMFSGAVQFNQDLTDWCVRAIPAEPTGFATSSSLSNANKPVWGTCPQTISGEVLLIGGASLKMRGTIPVASTITQPNGSVIPIGPGNWNFTGSFQGWYDLPMEDMTYLTFQGNTYTEFDFHPDFYTGNLTNMFNMFNSCREFNGDIANWDMSRVTCLSNMFRDARSFNSDISGWNTGAAVNMKNMFLNANTFNRDISSWNVSGVKNFHYTFHRAASFNQPLDNWDPKSANVFYGMFDRATAFNQPIGSWNMAKAFNMRDMFRNAKAFNQDLSSWNIANVGPMISMFQDTAFNAPLNWDTKNVKDMSNMFKNTSDFNQDIDGWDVRNVGNFANMFNKAVSFNQSLPNWEVTGIDRDSDFYNMFRNASSMRGDLSAWCVPSVTQEPSSFDQDAGFVNNTALQPDWGNCPITDPTGFIINDFRGDRLFVKFIFSNNKDNDLIFPDGSVVTARRFYYTELTQLGQYEFPMGVVDHMMFNGSNSSGQRPQNVDYTFESGFYTGSITNMVATFRESYGFNGDVSGFDVSRVTDFLRVFDNATSFNGDISQWDMSSAEDMSYMFDNATSFNGDISEWDMSKADNMSGMFNDASSYNQKMSNWDTGNVVNMSRMFQRASAFNQYLNPWDVSTANNMRDMFNLATAMNGDISNWCVPQFASQPSNFANAAAFENSTLLPDWGTCTSFNGVYLKELVGGTGDLVIGGVASDNTVEVIRPDGTVNSVGSGTFAHKYTQLGWYEIKNMESLTGLRFFDNDILFDDTSETAKFYFSDRFDTSNLNEFRQMFREADVFDGDLSMFDTSNATNMAAMFRNNAAFDADISHFDTTNVDNMSNMFRGAAGFTGAISGWSTFNVTDMDNMFRNATSFEINLSDWCVPLIASAPANFDTDAGFEGNTAVQPGWGGCPADFTIDTEVVIGTPTGVSPVLYNTVLSITTAATTTPAGVPIVSNQWQKSTDGGVTFTDIAGETGVTYTVTGADQNDQIRLTQVLQNGATSPFRTTTSNALTVENTIPNPDSYPTVKIVSPTSNATFTGAILHADGRLWTTPSRARETIGFLATDFSDQVVYPYTGSGTSSNQMGASTIIPDGRILWMNYYATKATIFDPTATNNADRFINFNSKGGGGLYGFSGAIVSSLNNKIYGLPYRYSSIVEVDPVNYTVTDVPGTSHTQYFYSGCEGPDQKIYLSPGTTEDYAVFDPSDNSFEVRSLPYTTTFQATEIATGARYVASNNSIYISPGQCLEIMKLDFNTLDANGHPTITAIDISSITSSAPSVGPQYMKAHIRGDGKLIFVPQRGNTPFLLLDPTDDSVIGVQNNLMTTSSTGGLFFEGSIILSDGKIVVFPVKASQQAIGVLETYLPNPNDPLSIATNYMQ